jgi:hypothetical protein
MHKSLFLSPIAATPAGGLFRHIDISDISKNAVLALHIDADMPPPPQRFRRA